jgi:hypothetical protein
MGNVNQHIYNITFLFYKQLSTIKNIYLKIMYKILLYSF